MSIAAYVVAAATVFWLGMILTFLGGLIFVILTAVLGVLKLVGAVSWSWWWIMVPLWGAAGGAFVKMRLAAHDSNL